MSHNGTHEPTGEYDLTSVRAVLFDMDGVLYRGNTALPGVNELLAFLADQSVTYACITNNASRTREQFSDKLKAMQIAVPPERIITSSTATSVWLRSRAARGTTVFAIGMDGLREALFGDDYFVERPEKPEYVVVGADFEVTYAKLKTACFALRAGAKFIGTNPDTTFPMEDGIAPGVGALIVALEAASDRKAVIIGKPERAMFDTALQMLGVPADHALAIGDRLDTDILGSNRAEVPSALVLTGVTTPDQARASEIKSTLIFDDLPHLLASWQAQVQSR